MPLVRRLSVSAADLRVGVAMVGAINGANLDFTAGELWVQDPTTAAIALYWNGVRQELGGDYTVSTTGPTGTGETVSMLEAPRSGDKLIADFQAD